MIKILILNSENNKFGIEFLVFKQFYFMQENTKRNTSFSINYISNSTKQIYNSKLEEKSQQKIKSINRIQPKTNNSNTNYFNVLMIGKLKKNVQTIKTQLALSPFQISNPIKQEPVNSNQFISPIKRQNISLEPRTYVKNNKNSLNKSQKLSVTQKIVPAQLNKTVQIQQSIPQRKCVKIELFRKKKNGDTKNMILDQINNSFLKIDELNLTQKKNQKFLGSLNESTNRKDDKQQKLQLIQKLKTENEILKTHNLELEKIHQKQTQKHKKMIEQLQIEVQSLKTIQKHIKEQLKSSIQQKTNNSIHHQQQTATLKNIKNKYQAQNNRLQTNNSQLKQTIQQLNNQIEQLKIINNQMILEKNIIKRNCAQNQFKVSQLQKKLKDNCFQLLYFSAKQENNKLEINLNRKIQQYQSSLKRQKEIINQLQSKFQQQVVYYKGKITNLEQQNLQLKKYQCKCNLKKKDQTKVFNDALKDQLVECQNMKQTIKNLEEQLYNIILQLNAEKSSKSNLQESLKVEHSKYENLKKLMESRQTLQMENLESERIKYTNEIKNLEQKIQYLLKQKMQKDEFFKNFLKDRLNTPETQQRQVQEYCKQLLSEDDEKGMRIQKQIIKIQ